MQSQEIQLSQSHRTFLDRFVAACQADARVVAAFLGGSYARGAADACSDLDLSLITTYLAHEDFVAGREAFLRQLGELVFLEDFDLSNIVFFIFSDGTEGELWFGSQSRLDQLHSGPYRVLLDKNDILTGAVFPEQEVDQAAQVETLRRLIYWFWHELSHFTTAMARGQLWWAHGQLEALRHNCMNLARLRQNFLDPDVGSESYFKIERALPVEHLTPLEGTFCPLEEAAMLEAAHVIVRCYQEWATPLAHAHGIPYPHGLERVMLDRLEQLPNRSQ